MLTKNIQQLVVIACLLSTLPLTWFVLDQKLLFWLEILGIAFWVVKLAITSLIQHRRNRMAKRLAPVKPNAEAGT